MSVTLIGLCLRGIPQMFSAALTDAIWLFKPLSGAEGDDSGGSSGSGSEGTDDEDDDDEELDDEGEETPPPADANEAARLAKKNGKLRKNLREMKGRLDALEAEKKTAQSAGKDETERLRGELAEANSKLEEQAAALQQSTLKQAFLESNKHAWHDPKVAFRLLDTSDIDIDEDGDISGMDDAVSALAEQHPYLIKSSGEKQDDKKDGKNKDSKGSSGEGGTKKKKSKDGLDREALLRKYPALH